MKMKPSIQVNEAEMNRCSLCQRGNHIVKWLKSTLAVGLAYIALLGLVAPLAAADLKPQPTNKKPVPTTLTGRVVFVDKALRALAVDVKGQILQVNAPPHLRITRAGKLVTLDEVVAGQEVTLTFRETVQGRLEVVLVTVEGAAGPAEAAGSKNGGTSLPGMTQGTGSANPANLGGQVRSPNH